MNHSAAGRTSVDVAQELRALASQCLRIAPADVPVDMPLSLLGLDSLAAVELAAAVEEIFAVSLGPEVIADADGLATLAAEIERRIEGGSTSRDPQFELMYRDAVLPADITIPITQRATSFDDVRTVLLTGATGFVGAFLLRELLTRTEARVVCLVRPSECESTQRLRAHLRRLEIEIPWDRVSVQLGDLERPRCGLDDEAFVDLAGRVDAVCHAGAAVNWVYSYSALRQANVSGTLELLRLSAVRGVPFHFVSSLSVCYSTSAPPLVDERCNSMRHLSGLPFGYAQTKCVAEALVRQAGDRGLPVRIYRPALISGDSRTGAYNPDDLIATLIRGCVRMGTVPDLDWRLDAMPVDVVAEAIVRLSAADGPVFHLAHPSPRHWRECALWMRMYGYPLRLVPYEQWLRELARDTARETDHPLRALRSFFLARPESGSGHTLPELYEEARRTYADITATRSALDLTGVTCPPLDAALLERYFAAFTAGGRGTLPLPSRQKGDSPPSAAQNPPVFPSRHVAGRSSEPRNPKKGDCPPFPGALLQARWRVRATVPLEAGSDESIVAELAAWRSRRPAGLYRYRLDLADDTPSITTRTVVLKLKPADADVIDAAVALAGLCDERLGAAFDRCRGHLGFTACDARELALYSQTDARFRQHTPALLGGRMEEGGGCSLALEYVPEARQRATMSAWPAADIDAAIAGMAALQAIWFAQDQELAQNPWMPPIRTAPLIARMQDMWDALAAHARSTFTDSTDSSIGEAQDVLVRDASTWWKTLDASPHTLIHNDFNPRNVFIRTAGDKRRVCALDWELATLGAPQHDLAELLCFVLPPTVSGAEVLMWIDRHREHLMHHTGRTLNPSDWVDGFRAALYDLMLDRLPAYALVHRVRRQAFLPRVVATWHRLYRLFPYARVI